MAMAISVSSMCWTSAGCSVSPQCCAHPVRAEPAVVRLARAAAAEVRDDGAAGERVIAEDRPRVTEPMTAPLSSVTASASACFSMQQRERVAQRRRARRARAAVGRPELQFGERTQRERLQRAVARRRTRRRSRPPAARGSRAACRTARDVRPARRIAIRSPILIASSMSCVTKTTVFRTSFCRRRNSSCRRARTIGSMAPNGSSMSMIGGLPASARARPTRWRWPPESCAG